MADIGDLVKYTGPENIDAFGLTRGAIGVITEQYGRGTRMLSARFFEQPGKVTYLHPSHEGRYWEVIPW